jgi:hypothetical protein
MEIIQVLLMSFGGTAAALVVAGFLSKKLVTQLLVKEMETYKADLEIRNKKQIEKKIHEYNVQLENKKAELEQRAKREERQIEYEQLMKKYKGPLLHAVYDLQSRLYKIIIRGLVERYLNLGNEHERSYVINNTVFVIAQYFAWTEIIRREVQFIDFASSKNTEQLSVLQDNIYGLWQTDSFGDKFRVWAGEQRAIGELMIEEKNGRAACIGYAKFLQRLKDNQEPLFEQLKEDVISLSKNVKASYPRLINIQNGLIDILKFLDPEGVRFPKDRRKYAR